MRHRLAIAASAALVVLAVTLVHEVLTPTPFHHVRAPGVLVLAAAIAAALLVLAPRVPSRGVALGAGIAAGGALGTLVSGIAWNGVPDPFVHGGIAFNVSDLAIALGDALMVFAVLLYAWTHRRELRQPLPSSSASIR
jgi:lipoprotein signal peptidase